MLPAPGRDYFQEIMACVESALPNWSVKHLSIWADLVQPVAVGVVGEVDLVEVEETTMEAHFQEIRSKIAILDQTIIG